MLFQATVGTVLLYNAETWMTTRALERRIDGIYTRLWRKALDVSWQQHMTNEELYGIPAGRYTQSDSVGAARGDAASC